MGAYFCRLLLLAAGCIRPPLCRYSRSVRGRASLIRWPVDSRSQKIECLARHPPRVAYMKKIAVVLVRDLPQYPRHELLVGLERQGFYCTSVWSKEVLEDCDLKKSITVTWNNYGQPAALARKLSDHGMKHFCMENGYTGSMLGAVPRYSVSPSQHHLVRYDPTLGCAINKVAELPVREFKNARGRHILVLGQRGGSYSKWAMPHNWQNDVVKNLREYTSRPIIYKPHPARAHHLDPHLQDAIEVPNTTPLSELLEDAFLTVVHSSSGSTESIIRGVPVVHTGPSVPLVLTAVNNLAYAEKQWHNTALDHNKYFGYMLAQQWSAYELQWGAPWVYWGVV